MPKSPLRALLGDSSGASRCRTPVCPRCRSCQMIRGSGNNPTRIHPGQVDLLPLRALSAVDSLPGDLSDQVGIRLFHSTIDIVRIKTPEVCEWVSPAPQSVATACCVILNFNWALTVCPLINLIVELLVEFTSNIHSQLCFQ